MRPLDDQKSLLLALGVLFAFTVLLFVFPLGSMNLAGYGYASNDPIPQGYAPPWDIHSNALFFTVDVEEAIVTPESNITLDVELNEDGMLFFKDFYVYRNQSGERGWFKYTFDENDDQGWIDDLATATVERPEGTLDDENWVLAYGCTLQSGAWICGCRTESDCGYWNIQRFMKPGVCADDPLCVNRDDGDTFCSADNTSVLSCATGDSGCLEVSTQACTGAGEQCLVSGDTVECDTCADEAPDPTAFACGENRNGELCDGASYDVNGTQCSDGSTCDQTQLPHTCVSLWYLDYDEDGYGDPLVSQECPDDGCDDPLTYIQDNTDCNDNDNTSYPGATEFCDGDLETCGGEIDESPETICGQGMMCVDGDCEPIGSPDLTISNVYVASDELHMTLCNEGESFTPPANFNFLTRAYANGVLCHELDPSVSGSLLSDWGLTTAGTCYESISPEGNYIDLKNDCGWDDGVEIVLHLHIDSQNNIPEENEDNNIWEGDVCWGTCDDCTPECTVSDCRQQSIWWYWDECVTENGCQVIRTDDCGPGEQCADATGCYLPTSYECSDGVDNDGDGDADLDDDGCLSASDNDESNCGDGVCEGSETSSSCSSDCSSNSCSSSSYPYCSGGSLYWYEINCVGGQETEKFCGIGRMCSISSCGGCCDDDCTGPESCTTTDHRLGEKPCNGGTLGSCEPFIPIQCASGWYNCDGSGSNGCESNTACAGPDPDTEQALCLAADDQTEGDAGINFSNGWHSSLTQPDCCGDDANEWYIERSVESSPGTFTQQEYFTCCNEATDCPIWDNGCANYGDPFFPNPDYELYCGDDNIVHMCYEPMECLVRGDKQCYDVDGEWRWLDEGTGSGCDDSNYWIHEIGIGKTNSESGYRRLSVTICSDSSILDPDQTDHTAEILFSSSGDNSHTTYIVSSLVSPSWNSYVIGPSCPFYGTEERYYTNVLEPDYVTVEFKADSGNEDTETDEGDNVEIYTVALGAYESNHCGGKGEWPCDNSNPSAGKRCFDTTESACGASCDGSNILCANGGCGLSCS